MDHAVDGYTVWGLPLAYKLLADYSNTVIQIATNANYTLTQAEFATLRPFSTSAAGDFGTGLKAINSGQVRAWVPILKDNAEFNCVIMTAAEFYFASAFLCFPGGIDDTIVDANMDEAVDAAAEFTLATYG